MSKYRFRESDIDLPAPCVVRPSWPDESRAGSPDYALLSSRRVGTIIKADMRKGNSLFCRAADLGAESKRLFRKLERENVPRDAGACPREQFAERLADYQCELIALHPFYEINGRITRLFCDLIAIFNGYGPIDYSPALAPGDRGNVYVEASIACVREADHTPLCQLLLAGLSREDRT